jgi:uncharacterized membrane protein YjjB (DUF3815 family)
MFHSLTILRELVQSLAKVTLLLKHSVQLRRRILCGAVAACCEMARVLFVVQLHIVVFLMNPPLPFWFMKYLLF